MKCRSFQPGGGVFLFAPLAMLMLTLASGSLVALRTAEAQQVGKVRRIGVLAVARPSAIEAFQQGLHELGWVEGQNITFESRSAEGERERLPALAAELVQLQVDLIVAMGGPSVVQAAKEATSIIPYGQKTRTRPYRSIYDSAIAQAVACMLPTPSRILIAERG